MRFNPLQGGRAKKERVQKTGKRVAASGELRERRKNPKKERKCGEKEEEGNGEAERLRGK